MKFYKTVLVPKTVVEGRYCFGKEADDQLRVCPYLNTEGGGIECKLGFFPKRNKEGFIEKQKECLELKEI